MNLCIGTLEYALDYFLKDSKEIENLNYLSSKLW